MERLLIVDDEVEVVEYFSTIFEQEIGLDVEIYKAYSAREALNFLENTQISIVLSDIKMPKISGLEMYEIIKRRWPECKMIFLSGVMTFEYVYATIQQKGVRYLTKLEPPEKIIATLQEVLEEIQQDYAHEQMMEAISRQLEEALPMLQNKYLEKILLGIEEDKDKIDLRRKELKIKLDFQKKVRMVAALFDESLAACEESYKEQCMLTVRNVAQKYFEEEYDSICYISEKNYLIWLLQEKESDFILNNPFISNKLESIQKSIKCMIQNTLTFAYYEEDVALEEMSKVYSYIKKELGYKSRILTETIINCGKYEKLPEIQESTEFLIDSQKQLVYIGELEAYLELGKEKLYFESLEKIIGCLKKSKSFHYGPAVEIYYRVMGVLLKYINQWRLEERLSFKLPLYKLTHLEMHDSWVEAVEYLEEVSRQIFDTHFAEEQNWSANAIILIHNYINTHMQQDLSLNKLAEEVSLNPSYLSRLFKSVTNENLYEHILQVRMNKAKELLLRTGNKVQDIGIQVGYESAQSFTRVFRKYTGKSPSEYREMNR